MWCPWTRPCHPRSVFHYCFILSFLLLSFPPFLLSSCFPILHSSFLSYFISFSLLLFRFLSHFVLICFPFLFFFSFSLFFILFYHRSLVVYGFSFQLYYFLYFSPFVYLFSYSSFVIYVFLYDFCLVFFFVFSLLYANVLFHYFFRCCLFLIFIRLILTHFPF